MQIQNSKGGENKRLRNCKWALMDGLLTLVMMVVGVLGKNLLFLKTASILLILHKHIIKVIDFAAFF